MIRVFLSHSHADKPLADALAGLLRTAIPLRANEIRSTSTPGHKPAAGAHTSLQLRREVQSADVLVGLVSAASLDSLYVAFELGARWGTEKPLIPLFAPGFDLDALRGPLAEYNGLRCDEATDLHQLVRDLAQTLDVTPEPPDAYQRALDAVLAVAPPPAAAPLPDGPSATGALPRLRSQTHAAAAPSDTPDAAIAREFCERKWGDDYSMLKFCLGQQRQAIATLRAGRPDDIPEPVFAGIRAKAARKWPDDFTMRVFTEAQEVEAYRQTRA